MYTSQQLWFVVAEKLASKDRMFSSYFLHPGGKFGFNLWIAPL
jgi:hypothetical protein